MMPECIDHERCDHCGIFTGRSRGDDESLYLGENGPYCDNCHITLYREYLDKLEQKVTELEAATRWRLVIKEKPHPHHRFWWGSLDSKEVVLGFGDDYIRQPQYTHWIPLIEPAPPEGERGERKRYE